MAEQSKQWWKGLGSELETDIENKEILGLTEAYKEIFATPKLNENISKLNGEFKNKPFLYCVQFFK